MQVELSPDVIAVLNGVVEKEKLANLDEAIRTLFNGFVLKSAVITNQENEIDALKGEIDRLNGLLKTAGAV